ncbi:MAG TPA: hypothetical protein VFQ91_28765 [Bryobacteraceae bacterium]|nr:hypothetical protein [Bryobacteraceae bacterium]
MIRRRAFLSLALAGRGLRLATFSTDVTPPLGAALCYGLVPPGSSVVDPLSARGVVLLPAGERPIVLCAVDWLGIGNQSRDQWLKALAQAVGTTPQRVALHTVHQHDAPGADHSALALLPKGIPLFDAASAQAAMARTAAAARAATPTAITQISAGAVEVDRVASNRRILDGHGKVGFGRMTACRNSPHCDAPEGVIDPLLRSVSFWSNDTRVATLSYYATHPMSYYGKGGISADFVGMARARQSGTFQVHFTGAAGNIGAGKYNNGSPEMRPVLAERIADAMTRAKTAEKPIPMESVRWSVAPVSLPLREGKGFSEAEMAAAIADTRLDPKQRANHARYLAYYRLAKAGRKTELSTLHIGSVHLLHMPGELFVEYQLAAAKERAGELVATAAYGDYGPMYIGTRRAYEEGGYETSAVSRVAPAVEDVLMTAVRQLLR